jgi:hypothetical protein
MVDEFKPLFEYFENEWMKKVKPNNLVIKDLYKRSNNRAESNNKNFAQNLQRTYGDFAISFIS